MRPSLKCNNNTMKLRFRPFESKQTIKIDMPNPCTLAQLKQILSQNLPNVPSPSSVHLSLNRKDELQSDGDEPIQSLGLASGDLVYFSIHSGSVQQNQIAEIVPENGQDSLEMYDTVMSESSLSSNNKDTTLGGQIMQQDQVFAGAASSESQESGRNVKPRSNLVQQSKGLSIIANSEPVISQVPGENLKPGADLGSDQKGSSIQMEESVEEYIEVDDDGSSSGDDGNPVEDTGKSFSVPGFLRKVFTEELTGDSGRDHRLIVIAVHAVLLESGFVRFDPGTSKEIDGFRFGNEWPSSLARLSLFYSLPQIVSRGNVDSVPCVMLKFQSLGKFINVYGSLPNDRGTPGKVRLNEDQLVPFLNVVWANCGLTENISGNGGEGLSGTSPEKEVFTFWKTVKDNLALPLLIDLCEKANLGLPPCFTRLPTDLKLKIMESLTGVDIARVSCVSSELRYLASNDELWKTKYVEQFGTGVNGLKTQEGWKQIFARSWRNRRLSRSGSGRVVHRIPRNTLRFPRNPSRFPWAPRIVGGPHDLLPFGDVGTRGPLGGPMRQFSPRCNLGGSSSSRNFV